MTTVYVRTTEGYMIPVEMPDDFMNESTYERQNENINNLRAMIPGNIKYIRLANDPENRLFT